MTLHQLSIYLFQYKADATYYHHRGRNTATTTGDESPRSALVRRPAVGLRTIITIDHSAAWLLSTAHDSPAFCPPIWFRYGFGHLYSIHGYIIIQSLIPVLNYFIDAHAYRSTRFHHRAGSIHFSPEPGQFIRTISSSSPTSSTVVDGLRVAVIPARLFFVAREERSISIDPESPLQIALLLENFNNSIIMEQCVCTAFFSRRLYINRV